MTKSYLLALQRVINYHLIWNKIWSEGRKQG